MTQVKSNKIKKILCNIDKIMEINSAIVMKIYNDIDFE